MLLGPDPSGGSEHTGLCWCCSSLVATNNFMVFNFMVFILITLVFTLVFGFLL